MAQLKIIMGKCLVTLILALAFSLEAEAGVKIPVKFVNGGTTTPYYDSVLELQQADCAARPPEKGCIPGSIDWLNRYWSVRILYYYCPGSGGAPVACPGGPSSEGSFVWTFHPACPSGSVISWGYGPHPNLNWHCEFRSDTPDPGKNAGSPPNCTTCGTNPIHPGIGNKYQVEHDYKGSGAFPLQITRSYNSIVRRTGISGVSSFGVNWRGNYDRSIKLASTETLSTANARRPDGRDYYFTLTNGKWQPDADISDKLIRLVDDSNNPVGWQYTTSGDEVETYDTNGKLVTIRNREGLTQTLAYNTAGLLMTVTDSFGRQIAFSYDTNKRVAGITEPDGAEFIFTYDANGNLQSVTYPGNVTRTYVYNEPSQTQGANLPYALTGIIDENGARFATWSYDTTGRAISSEHAGGANKVTLAYTNSNTMTATDALGTSRTYNFTTVLGVVRNTSVSGPCAGCGGSAAITFDANGNVASRTDFNGVQTTYSYDLTRNLETKRVEAAGTSEARTISTEWHPIYRLPTRIAEPKRLIINSYDDKGNLLAKTIQATSDETGSQGFSAAAIGTPRTWRYTYNQYGQVLAATGPRTDVDDTTRYAYDEQGNLVTITNAAGQVTTLSQYDANGRVGKVTDPNGLVTALAYAPRGWLTSKTVGGKVTNYEYDGVGQLKKVTQPDGSAISYTYDGAHRLTAIADSLGNRIAYTLDAMGNRIREEVQDPDGVLSRQTTRVYDALNRLQQITGGMQ